MLKKYICTSFEPIAFKKQMLQGTNLLKPLVSKVHNSECQNLPFPLQIQQLKAS